MVKLSSVGDQAGALAGEGSERGVMRRIWLILGALALLMLGDVESGKELLRVGAVPRQPTRQQSK
jgi:hypothetical protein